MIIYKNILNKLYDKKIYIICLLAIIFLFIIIYLYVNNQRNSNNSKEKFLIPSQKNSIYKYDMDTNITGIGSFTVPDGVTEVIITVIGGKGGIYDYTDINGQYSNKTGGFGGSVKAKTLSINQGDVFNFYLGNNGDDFTDDNNIIKAGGVSSDATTTNPRGNFGGGYGNMGGGGGAASYITLNNNSTPLIIAGGGGGASRVNNGSSGCQNYTNTGGGNGENYYGYLNGKGGSGTEDPDVMNSNLTQGKTRGLNTEQFVTGGGGGGGCEGGSSGYGAGGGAGGSFLDSTKFSKIDYLTDINGVPSIIFEYYIKYPTTTQSPNTTPNVPTTTPYVPTTTQNVPTTTPYVPTTTSNVPTTTSNVPTTTPYVPTTTPYVPTTTPYVPTITPNVPTTTPYVPTSSSSNPITTFNSTIINSESDFDTIMRDIQIMFPNISSNEILNLVNSGANINNFSPSYNNVDTIYKYENPELDIIQINFDGTSNVYSPYIYYDKNLHEKFI